MAVVPLVSSDLQPGHSLADCLEIAAGDPLPRKSGPLLGSAVAVAVAVGTFAVVAAAAVAGVGLA